jgi:hypothetical protein
VIIEQHTIVAVEIFKMCFSFREIARFRPRCVLNVS